MGNIFTFKDFVKITPASNLYCLLCCNELNTNYNLKNDWGGQEGFARCSKCSKFEYFLIFNRENKLESGFISYSEFEFFFKENKIQLLIPHKNNRYFASYKVCLGEVDTIDVNLSNIDDIKCFLAFV